jgi:MYXO-CTERM domain-containing protein
VKPVCVADLGICGCAGPTDDRSCGAADSGLICNGAGGFCVPGCGPAPRNGCPTGQNCLDVTNGVGQCSGALCHSDADCAQPLTHCDLSGGTDGRCVQCLFTTDCDAPLVCDSTKKKCVECAPGETDQCRPELAGSQCLTDGRCGCLADADCGSVNSGRVCDAAVSRCVPGCRGTGGNGCVNEMVCSSTTNEIGRCDERPMTDGGVDGSVDGGADGGADGGDGGSDAAVDAGDAGDAGADGAVADAGTDSMPPPVDSGADGGEVDPGRYIAGGGCTCATAPGSAAPAGLGLLLGLALAALRRRRRR